jgi:hypothetical protein
MYGMRITRGEYAWPCHDVHSLALQCNAEGSRPIAWQLTLPCPANADCAWVAKREESLSAHCSNGCAAQRGPGSDWMG